MEDTLQKFPETIDAETFQSHSNSLHWQNDLESGKDPNANCLTIFLFSSLPNPTQNDAKKFNEESLKIGEKSHRLALGFVSPTRDKTKGHRKNTSETAAELSPCLNTARSKPQGSTGVWGRLD